MNLYSSFSRPSTTAIDSTILPVPFLLIETTTSTALAIRLFGIGDLSVFVPEVVEVLHVVDRLLVKKPRGELLRSLGGGHIREGQEVGAQEVVTREKDSGSLAIDDAACPRRPGGSRIVVVPAALRLDEVGPAGPETH